MVVFNSKFDLISSYFKWKLDFLQKDEVMLNKSFYDSIARNYDKMASLKKQIGTKEKFFTNFVTNKTKTAADLGAGSGADSIALAKKGLDVTAFEPSIQMTETAQQNFESYNVNVAIHQFKISEIPARFNNSFYLIVCLGNTFANILPSEIEASVERVYDLLKRTGKVVIQLLNYDYVLEHRERIVNITSSEEKYFVRFYDFAGEKIFFNILSFNKSNPAERELITTEIFPYRKSFLERLLKTAGFNGISFYGDTGLNEFDEKTSKNLIITAIKNV